MAPVDAAKLSLSDGQSVRLHNAQGEVRASLHITDSVAPGVVALTGKWWANLQEYGAVANLLTSSAWSPNGQPAFNDTFVQVSG